VSTRGAIGVVTVVGTVHSCTNVETTTRGNEAEDPERSSPGIPPRRQHNSQDRSPDAACSKEGEDKLKQKTIRI